MLELRDEWLEILRHLLAEHLPDAEVLVYGSRVQGTSHDASDLDLVARNPAHPECPLSGIDELRDAIAESNLPILVDLHDWCRIPMSFRNAIEEHFEVVQRGKAHE